MKSEGEGPETMSSVIMWSLGAPPFGSVGRQPSRDGPMADPGQVRAAWELPAG